MTRIPLYSAFVLLSFQAALAAPTPKAFENNAVITGKITARDHCEKTDDERRPELWLSIGQILLYQVEVPVNGNYEFHVRPGKYEMTVNNPRGCMDYKEIEVKAKQVARLDLELNTSRGPATGGGHD
jgi:hypothetical protein